MLAAEAWSNSRAFLHLNTAYHCEMLSLWYVQIMHLYNTRCVHSHVIEVLGRDNLENLDILQVNNMDAFI